MIKQIRFSISVLFVMLAVFIITGTASAQNDEPPQTGLEIRNDGSWTTHEEELKFLEELTEKSDRVEYKVYGHSAEGLPMHLVKVGYPRPGSDEEVAEGRNIFIMGTIHGNEPSGREMSLKLMRDLAYTEDPEMLELLEKSTILFLPTANPDGREANRRRVEGDIDPNRDAITLKTPEHQVIAGIQNEFQPDIVLDAHERISGPNISVLGNLNLNVDEDLQQLNYDLIDNYMFPDLEEGGFTYDYYPPGAIPTNVRSMSGLRHSIGILTEGSWTDEPLVRVDGQMQAAESILRFYSERFDDIGRVVSESRTNKANAGREGEPFYLGGRVGVPATESETLDPAPCGYLLNERQFDRISSQIELFSIEVEAINNGYFVSMAQPMMTVIPFIMDERSPQKLTNGLAVYDCSDVGSMEPPSLPTPEQFETDFSEYEAGLIPDDWSTLWNDSEWTVKDQPKRLEHVVTDDENKRLLMWDKVGEVHGDVEIATVVRSNTDGELFQVHLHGFGTDGRENSYYLDVSKKHNESTIGISRLFGGRNTELNRKTLPFEIEVDTWYQIVLQREGDALRGKIWPYGEEEPEDWNVTVEQDIFVDFGNVGVGHDYPGMINEFKYFSVGTYGEEAKRAPADLLDELDKSVLERRVHEITEEDLDEENYSEESWEKLQLALNEAEQILEKTDVTQEEVDEAVRNLYEAYMSLAAQYQTDFSEYQIGQMPFNWSTLWRESGWTIKDDPRRLEHFVTEGGGRRVLTWDVPGDILGDVEVSALVKREDIDKGVMFQLHLQGSGDSGSENSYYLDVNNSGNIRINRNRNGGFSVLKSVALPFDTSNETWYQVVFKREGTMLKGKVWPYGTEEPEGWHVEVEDDNHFKGKVGVGHVTSDVTNHWAFFGVGTNDQDAPRAPEDLIVDKIPLELKIEELESTLDETHFTEESWSHLQTTIDEAKDLLNQTDIMQADILAAVQRLDAAYEALQTKSGQFFTDFSEYNVGQAPFDWSTLWRESGWMIKDDPRRLEHFVTEGGGRRVLTWDKSGTVYGDVEVSALVKKDDFDRGVMFQLHLQAYGEAGTDSSYYLDVNNSGNIRINRNRNGGFSVLRSVALPFDTSNETWYQVVFKREGTMLKGKVWPYGEEEPDGWHIEVEDDTHFKGKVGVGHVTSDVTNHWAFFGVGTNGEDAPRAPDHLVVDKTPLEDKINELESNLDGAHFSEESWENLQHAIKNAKDLLDQSEVTQLQINEEVVKLDRAYSELQTKSAQFFTNFSEYNVGESPFDWSTLWRESGWTIKDHPRRLEHVVTEGGKRRVLTWDEADTVYGDVEVSTLVRATDEGTTMFQVHLQGYGDAGSESSYYLDLRDTGHIRINRNLDATFTVLKSEQVSFATDPNTWYQVVFKREGYMLKGKVWPYGEDEPDNWQVEVEDDSHFKGKVGVGHLTTGMTNEWAFYGVGIGDMKAPRAPDLSATDLIDLVTHYGDEGEIDGEAIVQLFTTHLTAVSHYENNELADKVIKHMESFKLLLDHHKDQSLITEQAYETLYNYTDILIKQWE